MPHPAKKQKIDDHQRNDVVATVLASFDDLSIDVVANIFAFLPVDDTMRSRRINKKTREAKRRPRPSYRLLCWQCEKIQRNECETRALPNLQQIEIGSLGYLGNRHKWSDGEDPDETEEAARTANFTTHDIDIISNFSKLQILDIYGTSLNGRYPFLFNSFPLLQKLSISYCGGLKWDLDMLSGFPILKEFHSDYNYRLTGNIRSLRVLKDTLEKVTIKSCARVEGNIMDLADFPHLKELDLLPTAVTGDIRDIDNNNFSSLEELTLPRTIYGAKGSTLQSITDGPDVVRAVYLLKKQHPALKMKDWDVRLSEDSPDWYDGSLTSSAPPFFIRFVEAGDRIGYQWQAMCGEPCQVNWLDPEPNRESNDYEQYFEELQVIQRQVGLYKGIYQPPTRQEYNRLILYYESGRDEWN